MANAKIISFVDYQINAALEPVLDDVEAQRVDIVRAISVLTDRIRDTRLSLTNAIADNTLTLRRDINTLAAAINQLRQDVDSRREDMIDAITMVDKQIRQLRQDLDQLKQGGKSAE